MGLEILQNMEVKNNEFCTVDKIFVPRINVQPGLTAVVVQ